MTEILRAALLTAASGMVRIMGRSLPVDLTDRYLMLRYIEALQNLPSGALVIAPTQGGVPLLLNPSNR